ncbi:hypothetical protein M0R45_001293 [Rubus argutus]|uniref:Uncharacterized protein n=1 Tax=Rubus argutus TaxID=59490 RepID=A0AAW1VKE8_RUBAR
MLTVVKLQSMRMAWVLRTSDALGVEGRDDCNFMGQRCWGEIGGSGVMVMEVGRVWAGGLLGAQSNSEHMVMS